MSESSAVDRLERGLGIAGRVIGWFGDFLGRILRTWWATLLVVAGLCAVVVGGGELVDTFGTHCAASRLPGSCDADVLGHERTTALKILGVGVGVMLVGGVLYLPWLRPDYWGSKISRAVEAPVNRAVDRTVDAAWNRATGDNYHGDTNW
ncbi:hypothetical protein [Nocardia macrotermitis]|uniref:Uncharacterized protein n=1 Tax=Nocardia macrotermitis TaxID=2585198 RepID=A0A7K0CV42_9NOCA|nr:hypothetical protein [Nocardia macrotermitis]MQY17253.1 hypothetical protein [Nocardia macrotermitis]